MLSEKRFSLRTLVLIGVMSALVFALSLISFPLPIGGFDNTRIHFGNIMCLLGGVLFGPLTGGLCAGIGSMIYDLTNPLYIAECWITFLTKFAMGYVAGLLAARMAPAKPVAARALAGGICGQLTYILLYTAKSVVFQRFIYGNPWESAYAVGTAKLLVSCINGAIAVAGCIIIAPALRRALNLAGLFRQAGI